MPSSWRNPRRHALQTPRVSSPRLPPRHHWRQSLTLPRMHSQLSPQTWTLLLLHLGTCTCSATSSCKITISVRRLALTKLSPSRPPRPSSPALTSGDRQECFINERLQ